MKALIDMGPEKLLDTLQDLPRVGYVRTPNSIGYDLHYARKAPLPEGGERIVLLTDLHAISYASWRRRSASARSSSRRSRHTGPSPTGTRGGEGG